jgi:hypothetical protein
MSIARSPGHRETAKLYSIGNVRLRAGDGARVADPAHDAGASTSLATPWVSPPERSRRKAAGSSTHTVRDVPPLTCVATPVEDELTARGQVASRRGRPEVR